MQYKEIEHCRACKSPSTADLFSLGEQWLTDFPEPGKEKDGILMPLALVICRNCNFVQLKHTVNQDDIYGRSTYWYKSGINENMKVALGEVIDRAMELVTLDTRDHIIDIGSNDGTLASMYPSWVRKIGFEPSRNVYEESLKNVDWFRSHNDYFRGDLLEGIEAKVITSCAMFYDLDDPAVFLKDIADALSPDGIWVDQQNYLGMMCKNLTFDNISHEHLGYYSFSVFEKLIARFGLEAIDVELNGVNGGSFRTYVRPVGGTCVPFVGASDRLAQIRQDELDLKLASHEPYDKLYEKACDVREQLRKFILGVKARGKTVSVYAASTRGQVILQFCGLDKTLIDMCAERNPDKYGKVTIGTGIPIHDEEYVRAKKPDYMLILPYAFKDGFVEREKKYLEGGGAFIVPLPTPHLITKDSGEVPLIGLKA